MMAPHIIKNGFIDFHLPEEQRQTKLSEDADKRYLQLVCWCLVQRFWYYILHDPQVSDHDYDTVETYVAELEKDMPVKNEYSPTMSVGATQVWKYPESVQMLFSAHPRFKKGCHGKRQRQREFL